MEKPEQSEAKSACPQADSRCSIGERIDELNHKIDWLSEQVSTDALTGLYNRRHLDVALEQEVERTRRSGAPVSIAIMDADHFKALNDRHGHLVGDQALTHIVNIIRGATRKVDIACRYGGEEFAVILPSTPLMVAVDVVERIRQSIADTQLQLEELNVGVTVSVGLTTYHANEVDSPQNILARADVELYRAKGEGRNRVCFTRTKGVSKAEVSQSEKEALLGEDKGDKNG